MTVRKLLSKESTSRSENALFEVASCLNENWDVWMNVRLIFESRNVQVDREVDCILYNRQFGMLLVECKDGFISTKASPESENGFVWLQGRREMERSPVQQVMTAIHPLHDKFSDMFPRGLGKGYDHVRVQWAVCFPDMENTASIGHNAMASSRAILKGDLKNQNTLERKIKKILLTNEASRGGVPFPNDELSKTNYQKLVSFLGCFDEPTWPELWDMQAKNRLQPTETQEMMMDAISRNPKMRIEGVAGSGKSLLALWEARRLVNEGKSVAVLCYNDLLAENLKASFKESGLENVLVGSFFKIAEKYIRLSKVPGFPKREPADVDAKQDYYRQMPVYFAKALEILRGKGKSAAKTNRFFDGLIIDEGQDFENSWLDVCFDLLKSPQGIVRFFYDPSQTLYAGREVLGNEQVLAMPVMVLKRGFRSTKRILDWVAEETNIRIPCYENTIMGMKVKSLVYTDPEEQIAMLREEVQRIKSKGVEPKDILVVSLHSRGKSGLRDLDDEEFCWSDVNDSLNSQKINIVSVYRYKGLDKRVVILADLNRSANDPGEPHSMSHQILVGATRAKEHLVVFRQRRNI